jgi:hypothetical protein
MTSLPALILPFKHADRTELGRMFAAWIAGRPRSWLPTPS